MISKDRMGDLLYTRQDREGATYVVRYGGTQSQISEEVASR